MAETNPLRYRGYYYDSETGFYYLQSRYYDPTTCRFINADAYASTGQGVLGYNMFAYCRNSPPSRVDISGAADVECIDAEDPEDMVPDPEDIGYSDPRYDTTVGDGTSRSNGTGTSSGNANFGGGNGGHNGTTNAPPTTGLQTYYPPNNGFSGTAQEITLSPGTQIQRTGSLDGRFVAPAGTPKEMLSLPYNQANSTTTYFEVVKPINVLAGTVAPWFGQIGGGVQYLLLDGTVRFLCINGYIAIN